MEASALTCSRTRQQMDLNGLFLRFPLMASGTMTGVQSFRPNSVL